MLNRRDVLSLGVTAAASGALIGRTVQSAEADSPSLHIVDTNVSLFRWPFRRLPLDEKAALVKKLRSFGIAQAWAGSFEGILHRDISAANQRLVDACRDLPELLAIGSINPTLAGWREDLRRCIDDHKMPAIRLYPNYHRYMLDDPRFVELLKRTATAKCFVQIAAAMEDDRTQHELMRAKEVDLMALVDVMPRIEHARVQILNSKPHSTVLAALAKLPGVFFDTSRVEGTDGVPQLVRSLPPGRVMFGSHAPLLIPEAALIRVHESGQLDELALREVFGGNAERLLHGSKHAS